MKKIKENNGELKKSWRIKKKCKRFTKQKLNKKMNRFSC